MCVYTVVGIQVEEITILMGRWYIYEVEVVFFGTECNAHSLFFFQYKIFIHWNYNSPFCLQIVF